MVRKYCSFIFYSTAAQPRFGPVSGLCRFQVCVRARVRVGLCYASALYPTRRCSLARAIVKQLNSPKTLEDVSQGAVK